MCELLAISASAPVDVRLSLLRLAAHGGPAGQPDGWGIAFADGRDAHVWRDPHAAAGSPWVECLQRNPIRSELVVAHIRRATQGAVSLGNTQPFVRELWGRTHTFAHNGNLGTALSASRVTALRFWPIGETDSEAAFCAFLDDIARTDGSAADIHARFADTVRRLRAMGPANILYAGGGRLWVHADRRKQPSGAIEPPGLWLLERSCAPNGAADETAPFTVSGDALKVVLVASVPLSAEPWRPLPRGAVLEIAGGRIAGEEVA
ncbi:class II glutamine amidotransferase [Hyphomicrobium sp. DMF-1]|uniref:class II glutamine amidotransferase n=1 Tax=Hyphomicrobium sp. DMF-1 TaxID=3019544 RepID=UPI0022EBB6FA|nr:class II glutamine amidotransferase [Hyphomicrobium sp. DMF-1]WBT38038.1 class II glutamine amidotransferase [Hyphomicrobium sp. DMF-1]